MDTLVIDEEQLAVLRAMRLYHWKRVLKLRRVANGCVPDTKPARYWHKLANTHMGYVQQLNCFFDLGDTAEHDAAQIPHDARGLAQV